MIRCALLCLALAYLILPARPDATADWFTALTNGNLAQATRLLADTPALATAVRETDGATPLHLLAQSGSADALALAQRLVEHGATVQATDKAGNTPLHLARTRETAGWLLARGAAVNARNAAGATPLVARLDGWLHFSPDREMTLYLLDHGADPNLADQSGRTALLAALGVPGTADDLLQPFMEGFDLLRKMIPGIFRPSDASGDIAMLLLRRGADAKAVTKNGITTVIAAGAKGYLTETKALVAAGADPRAEAAGGYTALHLAAQAGNGTLVHYLIAQKLDPQKQAVGDITPLHLAAFRAQADAAAVLLKYGADANARTTSGNTPLHYACNLKIGGRENDTVRLLLAKGADPTPANGAGKTPRDNAVALGNTAQVSLLDRAITRKK